MGEQASVGVVTRPGSVEPLLLVKSGSLPAKLLFLGLLQEDAVLRDLLGVVLVGQLLLVHSSTCDEHATNDDHGKCEANEVVNSGTLSLVNAKGKVSPPVEGVEAIE